MRKRYSLRWRFLTLVLSQALALQGLLLGWGGAHAAGQQPLNGFGAVCTSVPTGRDGGEAPGKLDPHQDCVSLCAAGGGAVKLSGQASLAKPSDVYASILFPHEVARIERADAQAFRARAPPKLT
jgi:hypothetical protein